jgi:hypothetical protein
MKGLVGLPEVDKLENFVDWLNVGVEQVRRMASASLRCSSSLGEERISDSKLWDGQLGVEDREVLGGGRVLVLVADAAQKRGTGILDEGIRVLGASIRAERL